MDAAQQLLCCFFLAYGLVFSLVFGFCAGSIVYHNFLSWFAALMDFLESDALEEYCILAMTLLFAALCFSTLGYGIYYAVRHTIIPVASKFISRTRKSVKDISAAVAHRSTAYLQYTVHAICNLPARGTHAISACLWSIVLLALDLVQTLTARAKVTWYAHVEHAFDWSVLVVGIFCGLLVTVVKELLDVYAVVPPSDGGRDQKEASTGSNLKVTSGRISKAHIRHRHRHSRRAKASTESNLKVTFEPKASTESDLKVTEGPAEKASTERDLKVTSKPVDTPEPSIGAREAARPSRARVPVAHLEIDRLAIRTKDDPLPDMTLRSPLSVMCEEYTRPRPVKIRYGYPLRYKPQPLTPCDHSGFLAELSRIDALSLSLEGTEQPSDPVPVQQASSSLCLVEQVTRRFPPAALIYASHASSTLQKVFPDSKPVPTDLSDQPPPAQVTQPTPSAPAPFSTPAQTQSHIPDDSTTDAMNIDNERPAPLPTASQAPLQAAPQAPDHPMGEADAPAIPHPFQPATHPTNPSTAAQAPLQAPPHAPDHTMGEADAPLVPFSFQSAVQAPLRRSQMSKRPMTNTPKRSQVSRQPYQPQDWKERWEVHVPCPTEGGYFRGLWHEGPQWPYPDTYQWLSRDIIPALGFNPLQPEVPSSRGVALLHHWVALDHQDINTMFDRAENLMKLTDGRGESLTAGAVMRKLMGTKNIVEKFDLLYQRFRNVASWALTADALQVWNDKISKRDLEAFGTFHKISELKDCLAELCRFAPANTPAKALFSRAQMAVDTVFDTADVIVHPERYP